MPGPEKSTISMHARLQVDRWAFNRTPQNQAGAPREPRGQWERSPKGKKKNPQIDSIKMCSCVIDIIRSSTLKRFFLKFCWKTGTITVNYLQIIANIIKTDIPVLQRQDPTSGSLWTRVHLQALTFSLTFDLPLAAAPLPVSQLVQFSGPSSAHS